uniref:Uncharacterized protein n=1 Tax=Oryza punctata TaxID=4537 RepID=A0A0E0L8E0_ORYPU
MSPLMNLDEQMGLLLASHCKPAGWLVSLDARAHFWTLSEFMSTYDDGIIHRSSSIFVSVRVIYCLADRVICVMCYASLSVCFVLFVWVVLHVISPYMYVVYI